MKLAELFVDINGRDGHLNRTLGLVRGRLSAFSVGLGTLGGNLATAALSRATGALGSLYGAVIGGASDLSETVNKVNVVFGRAATTVTTAVDEMADKFGLAKGEMLDAAASIGLVGKAAGQSQAEAAAMAAAMAGLAADASSFYNVPLDVALEKIRAGLVGEAEPIRAFGVLLSENAVKAEALRLGLARGKGELSEAAKVAARASLIQRGLADATGDLARTSGGYANQVRALWGRVSNTLADLGAKLLPAATAIVGGVNRLVRDLADAITSKSSAIEAFAAKLAQLGPVIALGWRELPTVMQLAGVAMQDAFTGAVQVAKNVLVGLARFAADLFAQLGRTLSAHLSNALKDAASENKRLLWYLSAGTYNADKDKSLSFRQQPPPIQPNVGLIGNPFEGVGFGGQAKDLTDRLGLAFGVEKAREFADALTGRLRTGLAVALGGVREQTAAGRLGEALGRAGGVAAAYRAGSSDVTGASDSGGKLGSQVGEAVGAAAQAALDPLRFAAGRLSYALGTAAAKVPVLGRALGVEPAGAGDDEREKKTANAKKDSVAEGAKREGKNEPREPRRAQTSDITEFARKLQEGAFGQDTAKQQLKAQQETASATKELVTEVRKSSKQAAQPAVAG